MRIADLLDVIEEVYPARYAMAKDRFGLQVGSASRRVKRILVALDPDLPAVAHAIRIRADAIVSHHPIWWDPPRTLLEHEATGRGAVLAAASRIAVIAAHTNADFAPGGLCDDLAVQLGMIHAVPLAMDSIGRIGNLPKGTTWKKWSALLKKRFGPCVRYSGAIPKTFRRVACCSGSGSDLLAEAVKAGADVLVTGDVKYHAARDAEALGILLIDAGHFPTERRFVRLTAGKLSKAIPGVEIRMFESKAPFTCL